MIWAAVVLAGLASYAARVLPWLLLRDRELPPRLSAALQHAGVGAMAVMLVASSSHAGTAVSTNTPSVGRMTAVVSAVAAAVLLARRGRSMPVVVLSGLAVYGLVLGLAQLTQLA